VGYADLSRSEKEKAFDQTGVTVVSESANAKRTGNNIGLWLG